MNYIVFLYKRNGSYHYRWFSTEDLDSVINTDMSEVGQGVCFSKRLFKSGTVGSVYEFTGMSEDSINYKPKSLPKTFWQHKDSRKFCQVINSCEEDLDRSKRESGEKLYLKQLTPTKELLSKIPKNQRAFIIGEIINYLML